MTARHLTSVEGSTEPQTPDNPALAAVLSQVDGLVSPPGVYLRICELMRSPHSSAENFAQVISCDPSLTARLLRVVNSPFYNFRSRIDEINRAVAVIGMNNLYSMVLGISAARTFDCIATDLINVESFWRHSIYCGLIARNLAQRCNVLHSERLFVSGLLHDIGLLVLVHQLPNEYQEFLTIADGNQQVLYQAELDALGFSHAQAGGLLLKSWHVPQSLYTAVSDHHDPMRSPASCFDSSIVNIADRLAGSCEMGALFASSTATPVTIPANYWQSLGLDEATVDCAEILDEASAQFSDTLSLLGLNSLPANVSQGC